MISSAESHAIKLQLLEKIEQAGLCISGSGTDMNRVAAGKPGWWVSVNNRNDVVISVSHVGCIEIKAHQDLKADGQPPETKSLDEDGLITVRRFMTVKHTMIHLEHLLERQLHIHLKHKAA